MQLTEEVMETAITRSAAMFDPASAKTVIEGADFLQDSLCLANGADIHTEPQPPKRTEEHFRVILEDISVTR